MPERRVIDHLKIGVSDFERSREFYRRALEPLGFREMGPWSDADYGIAFGVEGADDFAISTKYDASGTVHIAFAAESQGEVDAFYAEAMAAGGVDNGPPGPRPEYSPGYYGAFVLDPDGNNVEAVHHGQS